MHNKTTASAGSRRVQRGVAWLGACPTLCLGLCLGLVAGQARA